MSRPRGIKLREMDGKRTIIEKDDIFPILHHNHIELGEIPEMQQKIDGLRNFLVRGSGFTSSEEIRENVDFRGV
jgi:hypothetical protein